MRIFLAIAAAALLVPAAVAGAAVESVVAVHYDLAAGEQPEGVAVDKRGDVYVSLAPLGQVWRVDRDGTERMLAQVVPAGAGNGVLGMAVDAPGNVYVAAATFDSASGVYKIARDGSFARLPGTEAIVFPNGVTLDKEGNVYITDTILGAVWRVPAGGGPAELWFQSAALLEGSGIFGFGFPLGANGIAYRQNALVVGNTEGGRLVRVEIEPDGSAGAISVLAEGLPLLAVDGIAFDVHGNVWAAVIAQSTIVRVSPTGDVTTIATAADGLDWASSIAFGKNGDLWAVNFAIGPPGGPGPALLRLDVGTKGQPVP